MTHPFILFSLQIIGLFLLSKVLHRTLSQFIFTLTSSKKVTVYLISFIFFLGTIVHEFSHLIMAQLLFVQTGRMELLPKVEGDSIKLGSVEISKPDPIRRLLIGVAPFIVGIILITGSLYLVELKNAWGNIYLSIFILLLIFQIGNTMFSSKKDLEGASIFILLLLATGISFFIFGGNISLDSITRLIPQVMLNTMQKGSLYLLIPIVIDIILISFFYAGTRLANRH